MLDRTRAAVWQSIHLLSLFFCQTTYLMLCVYLLCSWDNSYTHTLINTLPVEAVISWNRFEPSKDETRAECFGVAGAVGLWIVPD